MLFAKKLTFLGFLAVLSGVIGFANARNTYCHSPAIDGSFRLVLMEEVDAESRVIGLQRDAVRQQMDGPKPRGQFSDIQINEAGSLLANGRVPEVEYEYKNIASALAQNWLFSHYGLNKRRRLSKKEQAGVLLEVSKSFEIQPAVHRALLRLDGGCTNDLKVIMDDIEDIQYLSIPRHWVHEIFYPTGSTRKIASETNPAVTMPVRSQKKVKFTASTDYNEPDPVETPLAQLIDLLKSIALLDAMVLTQLHNEDLRFEELDPPDLLHETMPQLCF